MSVKLLAEHHLEFLSFEGGCTGSSESTLVKIPHCWKSHVAAQLFFHVTYEVIFVPDPIKSFADITIMLFSRLLYCNGFSEIAGSCVICKTYFPII